MPKPSACRRSNRHWLARWLPVWLSVAIVLGFEALTIWLIRDGLALNVLMLLWPLEAVKTLQAGG